VTNTRRKLTALRTLGLTAKVYEEPKDGRPPAEAVRDKHAINAKRGRGRPNLETGEDAARRGENSKKAPPHLARRRLGIVQGGLAQTVFPHGGKSRWQWQGQSQ